MLSNHHFEFSIKQDIVFGIGSIGNLPEKAINHKADKLMIVADPGVVSAGLVQKVSDVLKKENIVHEVFGDVALDPDGPSILKCVDALKAYGAKGIVSIGGGSSIDTAKGAAIILENGGEVEKYEGKGKVPGNLIPIFAIPTTVGTGSESTPFTILTSNDNRKMVVGSEKILPKCAFLDPDMVCTLPPKIAAATGVDAITHAVEAYISLISTPFSDYMAEKAIELLGANIRPFVANRLNMDAAAGMLLGSNLAGIAFAMARLGNAHAMAHPLGGLFHIPHGVSCAVVLPAVLEYNALSDTGKFEKMYKLLKGPKADTRNFEPTMVAAEIRKLLKDIGLPGSLSELGISENDIPALVEDTMRTTTLSLINPRQTTEKDFETLFYNAL